MEAEILLLVAVTARPEDAHVILGSSWPATKADTSTQCANLSTWQVIQPIAAQYGNWEHSKGAKGQLFLQKSLTGRMDSRNEWLWTRVASQDNGARQSGSLRWKMQNSRFYIFVLSESETKSEFLCRLFLHFEERLCTKETLGGQSYSILLWLGLNIM